MIFFIQKEIQNYTLGKKIKTQLVMHAHMQKLLEELWPSESIKSRRNGAAWHEISRMLADLNWVRPVLMSA